MRAFQQGFARSGARLSTEKRDYQNRSVHGWVALRYAKLVPARFPDKHRVAVWGKTQLRRAIVHALALLTILARCGLALDPTQPAGSYIRTAFTVEDGLPSNVVNAIVQTRNGFLWIGTDAGLARFDGRHFTMIDFRGPRSCGSALDFRGNGQKPR
jgi:Two component regulator propeller